MPDRSIRVRFIGDVQNLRAAMQQAGRDVTEFGRNLTGHGKATREEMERVGRASLIMSAGVGAGLALSAKAAIDWESAWAGVTKTVDGTDAQLADLEQGLRDLAKELPATHGEIAAVAEAAGQLGVQRENIEAFTRTMIDLGETTNLTADEAATSIAQMMNVMQTAPTDVDNLGSALVALGNNGASTERDIVQMSQRIAGAANIIGLSEHQVLAFANAFASTGVEVEAGGTAISRTFTDVASAVSEGGEDLETFAKVAGMTSREFATLFRRDAAGALTAFVEGLNRVNATGGDTFKVLEALGVTEQRQRDALLRAAGAGDELRASLELGAQAWEENNALQTEAEKRYATTAAQLEMLRNQVNDLGIDVGQTLLPAISGATDVLGSMVRGVQELPGPANTAAVGLGAITTGGLGLIGVLGIVGPKIKAAQEALDNMGAAGQFAARNMGRAATVLGIAGVAVAGLSYVLGEQAKRQAEAAAKADEYTQAILEQGSAVGQLTDELQLQNVLEGSLGENLRKAGADLQLFNRVLRTSPDDVRALNDALNDQIGLLGGSGSIESALERAGLAGSAFGDELTRLLDTEHLNEDAIRSLIDRLEEEAAAHANGTREAKNKEEADRQAGRGAKDAGADVDSFTDDIDENKRAMEESKEAAERWREGVERAFAPLEAQASLDDFTMRLGDIRDTFEEAEQRVADIRDRISEVNANAAEAEGDLAARIREAEADLARALTSTGEGKADRVADARARLAELRSQVGQARADANKEIASLERDLQEAIAATSRALDGNSEAALRNRGLMLDATNRAVAALEDAAKKEGVTWEELTELQRNLAKEIETQGKQIGFNKDEVDEYADVIRELPLEDLFGPALRAAEDINAELDKMIEKLYRLIDINPFSSDVAQQEKFINRKEQERAALGHAHGGYLKLGQWHEVGEHGKELVSPSGYVYPAMQTASMLGAPGGSTSYSSSSSYAPTVNVQVLPGEDPYARAGRELRKMRFWN